MNILLDTMSPWKLAEDGSEEGSEFSCEGDFWSSQDLFANALDNSGCQDWSKACRHESGSTDLSETHTVNANPL